MIAMISVEKWKQSEFFYQTIVPILFVVGLLAVLLLFILLLYRENQKKIPLLISAGTIIFCGAVFLVGNQIYQDFKPLDAVVTPNIRDRKKQFAGYKYYDDATLSAYQRIQSEEAIETLGIYKSVPVSRDIEFLGFAYDSIYFKVGAQSYYLRQEPVFEDVAQAQLKGIQYQLTEPEYESIGFFAETNYYLKEVVIPEKLKAMAYESEDGVIPKEFSKSQAQWAVESK